MNYRLSPLLAAALFVVGSAQSQQLNDVVERGRELYHSEIGCHVCHGATGTGLVGPSLLFGPSPVEIFDQLESNPVMGVIVEEMDPSDEDLAAISMYLRELGGLPLDSELPEQWLSDLRAVKSRQETDLQFVKTERDLQIEAIETFESVQATWTRRAKEGSLLSHYDAEVLATYDPGEPKFTPEPGKTYFYENVGTNSRPAVLFEGYELPESSSVVVGDAETHEVIASQPLPVELRGAVHTSLVSPDGRYVYIVGPRPSGDEFDGGVGSSGGGRLGTSATLVKVDAITLEPIAQIDIGGRLHHGQIFRDYLLLDMFGRDQGGLALMLLDPDTDEIIGGIRDVDLGGYAYTVWTDPDYEYIYALMEPAGYATGRATGMFGAISMYQGRLMAMRPYWVAKINPDTWEVEAEFPVPGYRPNWVVVDSANEYLYVVNTMSNVAKMDANTGEVIWTNGTGIGPYGGTLNADETELWIADKGEAAGHFGRTLTVLDANSGQHLETVFSGYMVDHVLLAPNGREMWATSNAEGRLYVYDAETRELIKRIEMPGNGDAHGLIWVHYDDNGVARTVRDQGNFHNGVHPMRGTALDY